jgi:hypothetical protein
MAEFPGIAAQVSIEDLVHLLSGKSEKVRAQVLEFLSLRCADPRSDWIFALLFDAGIDRMLGEWLLEGSFRLKRAVLAFARLVLQHASEAEKITSMLNEAFLCECAEFLCSDSTTLYRPILRFLELIPRKATEADLDVIANCLRRTELMDRLEELALTAGEVAPMAHGIVVELRQLLDGCSFLR